MGAILDELLSELEKRELDEKIKIICDKITKEERPDGDDEYLGPLSPNIFLSLHANTLEDKRGKKTHKFVVLERESVEVYVVCVWTRFEFKNGNMSPLKKTKSYPVKEGKAEKILKIYAQYLQNLKGE